MEAKEWTTTDKSSWGDGPWQSEPDKAQWTDDATGLPCLVKRNGSGSLCGYVGVSEGHPWFSVDYDSVSPYPDVHGGLTYADFCQEGGDEALTICHVPAPGEPDRVWWLGFDCAHAGDLSPAYRRRSGFADATDVYRTLVYVRHQCASLAVDALAAAGASSVPA